MRGVSLANEPVDVVQIGEIGDVILRHLYVLFTLKWTCSKNVVLKLSLTYFVRCSSSV